jgi:hypothetical protein
MTIRWTLNDGVTTYQFHVNPSEMGSLGNRASIETLGNTRVRAREAKQAAYEWSFAGKIYSQAQYDALELWSEKKQVLTLTDHLSRPWQVVILAFMPKDVRRPGTIDRWTYEVRVLVIADNSEPLGYAPYRDHLLQPFADASIWNTPIGDGATTASAGLAPALYHASDWVTVDPIFLGMDADDPTKTLSTRTTVNGTPGATVTPNYTIPGGTTVHVPADLSHTGTWNGIAGFVDSSDTTKAWQGQTLYLTAGGNPSWAYTKPLGQTDLLGDGIAGIHGGSGLSGLGGTIRKWEWDGTEPILHALSMNLYGRRFLSTSTSGYRWPATKADSGYNTDLYPGQTGVNQLLTANGTDNYYGSANTNMKMGSLLCLPQNYDIASITNAQVKRIATALRDFGAYVVDNTARDVHAFSVESTIKSSWEGAGATFHSELMDVISDLLVVTNSASNAIGGGGTPYADPPPPLP